MTNSRGRSVSPPASAFASALEYARGEELAASMGRSTRAKLQRTSSSDERNRSTSSSYLDGRASTGITKQQKQPHDSLPLAMNPSKKRPAGPRSCSRVVVQKNATSSSKRPRRIPPVESLILRERVLKQGKKRTHDLVANKLRTKSVRPDRSLSKMSNKEASKLSSVDSKRTSTGNPMENTNSLLSIPTVARIPLRQQKSFEDSSSVATTSTTTGSNRLQVSMTGTTTSISNIHLKPKALVTNDLLLMDRVTQSHGSAGMKDNWSTLDVSPYNDVNGESSSWNSNNRSTEALDQKSFVIDDNTPFFALLEGIETRPTHAKDTDNSPSTEHDARSVARVLELPAEARYGVWRAKVCNVQTGRSGSNAVCISIRHQSHASLGHLEPYAASERIANDPKRARYSDGDALAVSQIRPKRTRQLQIDSQRTLDGMDIPNSLSARTLQVFISSISIAGFEGFSCNFEQNALAAKTSTSILEGRKGAHLHESTKSFSCLHRIFQTKVPIGVSIDCELNMDSDYNIFYAQLLSMKGAPIVAIDVLLFEPVMDRLQSGLTQQTGLTTQSVSECSFLSEENLSAHTRSTGAKGYDPLQRLQQSNPTKGRPVRSRRGEGGNKEFSIKPSSMARARSLRTVPVSTHNAATPSTTKVKKKQPTSLKRSRPATDGTIHRPYKLKFKARQENATPSTRSSHQIATDATIPASPTESPLALNDDRACQEGEAFRVPSRQSKSPIPFVSKQKRNRRNLVSSSAATAKRAEEADLEPQEETISKRLEKVFLGMDERTKAEKMDALQDTVVDAEGDPFFSCTEEVESVDGMGFSTEYSRNGLGHMERKSERPVAKVRRFRARPFGSSFGMLLLMGLQMLAWMTNRQFEAHQSFPMKQQHALSLTTGTVSPGHLVDRNATLMLVSRQRILPKKMSSILSDTDDNHDLIFKM